MQQRESPAKFPSIIIVIIIIIVEKTIAYIWLYLCKNNWKLCFISCLAFLYSGCCSQLTTAPPVCGSQTPFPAVQPSQLCLLPCPPTSAPQKQYPAFSTQMEVTPYASKPLSFCQGSWGLAAFYKVTVDKTCSFFFLFLSFAGTFSSYLFLFSWCSSKYFLVVSALSYTLFSSSFKPSMCICSRCFGSITFWILMHDLNKFSCKVCHKV